jgi:GNAT superfamily N-acetyltransferase
LSGERRDETDVLYSVSPTLCSDEVNDLFAAAWGHHERRNFDPVLQRSLVYVGAYRGSSLVGFVNVVWDGGAHAFVLDTTVHPDLRRRGIGRRLVLLAADEARERGIRWLHVDFEPHLRLFYGGCGFRPTEAGLLRLDSGGDA